MNAEESYDAMVVGTARSGRWPRSSFDGRLSGFAAEDDASVVRVGPDFYVFGIERELASADRLVAVLGEHLGRKPAVYEHMTTTPNESDAMRLVSYESDGAWRSGIAAGDFVADAERVAVCAGWNEAERAGLHATRAVLALEPARLGTLTEAITSGEDELRGSGALRPRDGLHLGPPVPDPPKIICLGLNYRDHAEEAGLQEPAAPMFFAKWANSLIGPADAIVPPAAATETMDYEAELAVVIGTRARDIDAARALDHVAGAMAFNDVSDRELQMANNLWTGGKAIDTYGPCGPALVLLDEIDDLQALGVRTRVNGETVQDGTTAQMIFPVAEVIRRLSRIMTLEPGDLIATGTPAGVGNSRDPQLFLHAGDVVEVEIDDIGVLRNPVAEPLASSSASQNRNETHA